MKNMKMLLIAGSILPMFQIDAQAAEAECVEAKDCEEMGYTVNVADCVGPALKCPWDLTKAKCKTETLKYVLPAKVVYGDGTVSDDVETLLQRKRVPIGVVVDEEKKVAAALQPVKKDGTPGPEAMLFADTNVNISALDTCDYTNIKTTCGIDGRKNTDIILKQSGTYYAVQACNKYEPAGCTAAFCKKGKWFLPSYAEGIVLLNSSYDIRKTMFFMGKEYFKDMSKAFVNDVRYWTSTKGQVISDGSMAIWNVTSGGGTTDRLEAKWGYLRYVYPFVKYN